MTFFLENKIFIAGSILLVVLIAGASALQKGPDSEIAETGSPVPVTSAPDVARPSMQTSTQNTDTAPTAAAPETQLVAEAAPTQPSTTPGAKPSIQGRFGDDEEDDD